MLKTILGFTTMVLLRPLFTNFRTIGETFYLDCLFLLHCTLNKSLTVFYLRKYGIFGVVLYYMFFLFQREKNYKKTFVIISQSRSYGYTQAKGRPFPNWPKLVSQCTSFLCKKRRRSKGSSIILHA